MSLAPVDYDRLDRFLAQRAAASNGSVQPKPPNAYTRPLESLPPYPVAIWPPAIADYLTACAASVDAPVAMAAAPLLSILGAVIGNRRSLMLKPGFVLRPTIWTLVMADPTTGKTPMLEKALDLVRLLQAAAVARYEIEAEEYERGMAEAKRRKDTTTPKPQPPLLEQYFTNNATMEWFAPAARDSAGIAMVRDELLGWFRDMDAYRAGKGGDRQTWLTLWSGGSLKVDRKGGGTIFAERPVVTVTGGIQPGRFPELAKDAQSDGFMARFLISTHSTQVPGYTEEEVDPRLLDAARELVARMRLTETRPPLPVSVWAKERWKHWHEENKVAIEQAIPEVRAFYGKLPQQVGKAALVLHAAWDAEGYEESVPEQRMEDAVSLVEYHRAHTVRAYELMGVMAEEIAVGLPRRIVRALARTAEQTASRAEIHRLLGGHVDKDVLSRALDDLEARGAVVCTRRETDGRPADIYTLPRDGE